MTNRKFKLILVPEEAAERILELATTEKQKAVLKATMRDVRSVANVAVATFIHPLSGKPSINIHFPEGELASFEADTALEFAFELIQASMDVTQEHWLSRFFKQAGFPDDQVTSLRERYRDFLFKDRGFETEETDTTSVH